MDWYVLLARMILIKNSAQNITIVFVNPFPVLPTNLTYLLFSLVQTNTLEMLQSHKLDDEDVVQIVTKTIKQQANSSGYAMLAQEYQDKHAKKRLAAKKQKQKRLGG